MTRTRVTAERQEGFAGTLLRARLRHDDQKWEVTRCVSNHEAKLAKGFCPIYAALARLTYELELKVRSVGWMPPTSRN